jgi:enoyl-CoA hydratase/carnithine racemase
MITGRLIDGRTAPALVVDHVGEDGQLNAAVEHLASETFANSPGTNRIDKALVASAATSTPEEALRFERTAPFGAPKGMKARMANGWRSPRAASSPELLSSSGRLSQKPAHVVRIDREEL